MPSIMQHYETNYTLSTSSDSEDGCFGGREFTFEKQANGDWRQRGGAKYKFNGFGQMTNIKATAEQKQQAKDLIQKIQKGN